MAADAIELGEHPGYEASHAVRVRNVARERFELDIAGEVVAMMSAGRLAEEYDVGRRSHVADVSCAFSHLTLNFGACDIRAAGAAGKRAAG
jgi:hypothetical protein